MDVRDTRSSTDTASASAGARGRGTSAAARRGDLALTALGAVGFITTFIGIAMAFLYAPTDRVQGHAYRIVYIHAPVAWLAYLSVGVVFVASIGYLWKRSMLMDRFSRAAAELGFLFISLALVTGSLWGRPIWNAWWSWDARLTTTLILWFIYLGYFTLRAYAGDRERAARYGAVLGIVAMVDVPIIHQSVTWWRTLHPQPVVLKASGPNLGNDMLVTLLVCFIGLTVVFAYLLLLKVQVESVRDLLLDRDLDRTFSTDLHPHSLMHTHAHGDAMTTLDRRAPQVSGMPSSPGAATTPPTFADDAD